MIRLFYACVRDTLYEFLDEKGRHGFIATFQSWGSTLYYHPHIHCLITAFRLTRDGKWRDCGCSLLSVKAASEVFRAKLLEAVTRAFENGSLTLPPELTPWPRMRRRLQRRKWNVYIQSRAKPDHVLDYLARYICGGPIGNSRLVSTTPDSVTFRYKNYRTRKKELMTLTREKFLHRFMLHVPAPGMRLVRSYGLYSSNHPEFPPLPVFEREETTLPERERLSLCPSCGATLILVCANVPEEEFHSAEARASPAA